MTVYTPQNTDGPRVGGWMSHYVRQTIGRFAGKPLTPEWWQQMFLDAVYEYDPATGRRIYTDAVLCTPKKNGKSTFGAGLGLYGLCADYEQGPECYVAASRLPQAKVIHNQAKAMVEASPGLRDWLKPWQHHIACPDNNGIFRVLPADAKGIHGVNPFYSLIDEKWAHPNQDLIAALAGGTGAREEPLTVTFTTVGHELDSPFGEDYKRALRCPDIEEHLDGFLLVCRDREAGFIAFIFAPPFDHEALLNGNVFTPTVDLEDPEVWEKVNPASWITEKYLRQRRANTRVEDFRRFHLNAWTESEEFWLPAGAWDACRVDDLEIEDDRKAYIGVDMGGKRDAAAVIVCAPDDRDGEPPWLDIEAHIIESPEGDEKVDPAVVRNVIRAVCARLDVQEIAYDPWRFEESAQTLADDPALDGVEIVEFPQTNTRMAPASQRLYDVILALRLRHDGHTKLASHIAGAKTTETDTGWRLTKRKATTFCDGAIGTVMAVARAEAQESHESKYEEEDPLVL